eukprot:scaffold259_cov252-Pinguiococcus_pyrenoidosus.AAC.3
MNPYEMFRQVFNDFGLQEFQAQFSIMQDDFGVAFSAAQRGDYAPAYDVVTRYRGVILGVVLPLAIVLRFPGLIVGALRGYVLSCLQSAGCSCSGCPRLETWCCDGCGKSLCAGIAGHDTPPRQNGEGAQQERKESGLTLSSREPSATTSPASLWGRCAGSSSHRSGELLVHVLSVLALLVLPRAASGGARVIVGLLLPLGAVEAVETHEDCHLLLFRQLVQVIWDRLLRLLRLRDLGTSRELLQKLQPLLLLIRRVRRRAVPLPRGILPRERLCALPRRP